MIEAIIFDLDGTLLDSEILWVDAYVELLRRCGIAITRNEAIELVYGRAFADVYAGTLRQFINLNWTADGMIEQFRAIYRDLAKHRDLRIHSSIKLLRQLAREFPVCLVSGASREDVNEGIRVAEIASVLRFALSSEDYAPGKPDPAGFLLAARMLQVPPRNCLVFEDSAAGVKAAKEAEMFCVALARPGRPAQDFSRADLMLEDLEKFSLSALAQAVENLCSHRKK
jgi:mannitol-1-/sugar-/sorbitol-6-phosphatase